MPKPKSLLARANEVANSDSAKWTAIGAIAVALITAVSNCHSANADRARVEAWHNKQRAINYLQLGSNLTERVEQSVK
jgi:hypothetical protein